MPCSSGASLGVRDPMSRDSQDPARVEGHAVGDSIGRQNAETFGQCPAELTRRWASEAPASCLAWPVPVGGRPPRQHGVTQHGVSRSDAMPSSRASAAR